MILHITGDIIYFEIKFIDISPVFLVGKVKIGLAIDQQLSLNAVLSFLYALGRYETR